MRLPPARPHREWPNSASCMPWGGELALACWTSGYVHAISVFCVLWHNCSALHMHYTVDELVHLRWWEVQPAFCF